MNPEVRYVEDEEQLERLIEAVRQADVIALDTESDSMHCYFEKVCVLQLEVDSRIYLVDTIRLRRLEGLVAALREPLRTSILHGADYDVVCLSRDFGVRFGKVFDTMLAAQFLGRPAFGLAALCEAHFGVKLDKSLTRHNWARRPLEPRHLKYLAEDVIYLRRLADILREEIIRADIVEEVELECLRVSELEWSAKTFDPDGWVKVKGSRDLNVAGRRVLKALWIARDEVARRLDMPPFMVLNNEAILKLCDQRPVRKGDFARTVSLSRRLGPEDQQQLFEAVASAVACDEPLPLPRGPRMPRRTDAEMALEENLRRWRNQLAERRGIFGLAILPNHVMLDVVRIAPRSLEELANARFLGQRRLEKYGRDILEVVDRTLRRR